MRDWFETKREEYVLLKVVVTNKSSSLVKATIKLEQTGEDSNLRMPLSLSFKEHLFSQDQKCLCHLQKILPYKPFTPLSISITSLDKHSRQQPIVDANNYRINVMETGTNATTTTTTTNMIVCPSCA